MVPANTTLDWTLPEVGAVLPRFPPGRSGLASVQGQISDPVIREPLSMPPKLDDLSLEDLREIWRVRYGAPPALRSPELLQLMLAWRIQVESEQGLDRDIRLALRRPPAKRSGPQPVAGARLVREWQGRPHEVVVMSDGGFLYRGERFGSLSKVARRITGVRWNGPRFFGLRKDEVAA